MPRRGRRGEGTVFWSKADRRWIAKWPLGVVDGKRQDKRAKFRSRDEADAELERFRRLYGSGGHATNETLGAYLARWLPEHRGIRDSTRTSYAGHIRLHIDPLLGGVPLGRLQPSDVRRLISRLEHKGLSAGTIHLVFRTLSAAMSSAVNDRIIVDNPTDGVRLPRIDRAPVHPMTDDEADAILRAVTGTWVELPVRVMLGSGIRLGEACGLDQRDLVLDSGFIRLRVSKTIVRAVPITDDAVDALRTALVEAPRRGPAEPVFFGQRGPAKWQRIRPQSVTHALPRILEASGPYRLSPHGLRHGVATMMLAKGYPLPVIGDQLGQSERTVTRRYAHVLPEAQAAAVRSIGRRRTS